MPGMRWQWISIILLIVPIGTSTPDPLACPAEPESLRLASAYAKAIELLNKGHAEKPTVKSEDELKKQLPPRATETLKTLIALKDGESLAEALTLAAEASLDLDRTEDFDLIQKRLQALSPDSAAKLGVIESRSRFQVRGVQGVKIEGVRALADAFDRILDAYAEVFGFVAFSKVPGKKLRLHVHKEDRITKPPHFAPQFKWHSQIDFPVIDADAFRSPTEDGKFLFYGLCHELGHVIAMWGDLKTEEDHHSWAHYTGIAIVEHLSGNEKDPMLSSLRDVRWRSLKLERERLSKANVQPGPSNADRFLALLLHLHDTVGPKSIGTALNSLDTLGRHARINRVRYYRVSDFESSLLSLPSSKRHMASLKRAFKGE